MPGKLIAPIEKEFILEKTDILLNNAKEGSPTTVTIRQATQGQHTLRADKYANAIQEVNRENTDTYRYITRFSNFELVRTEAYLTMIGCNLLDEEGYSLFKFKLNDKGKSILAMTESEFNNAWATLPSEIADEIGEKVREVNIRWRMSGELY